MAVTILLAGTIVVAVVETARQPHERTLTEPEAHQGPIAEEVPHDGRASAVARRVSGSVSVLYRHRSAAFWAWRYRVRTKQLQAARAAARRRWQPTVDYALRLANAVYGVPYGELRAVAWCESKFYPFAVNGQYKGIFQMHWSPFGFSPFDPVASALSAAQTVRADGSWRQWECKP